MGMTLPIARELAQFEIRCMAIAPGIFHTPMMNAMSPELQESLGKQVPFLLAPRKTSRIRPARRRDIRESHAER